MLNSILRRQEALSAAWAALRRQVAGAVPTLPSSLNHSFGTSTALSGKAGAGTASKHAAEARGNRRARPGRRERQRMRERPEQEVGQRPTVHRAGQRKAEQQQSSRKQVTEVSTDAAVQPELSNVAARVGHVLRRRRPELPAQARQHEQQQQQLAEAAQRPTRQAQSQQLQQSKPLQPPPQQGNAMDMPAASLKPEPQHQQRQLQAAETPAPRPKPERQQHWQQQQHPADSMLAPAATLSSAAAGEPMSEALRQRRLLLRRLQALQARLQHAAEPEQQAREQELSAARPEAYMQTDSAQHGASPASLSGGDSSLDATAAAAAVRTASTSTKLSRRQLRQLIKQRKQQLVPAYEASAGGNAPRSSSSSSSARVRKREAVAAAQLVKWKILNNTITRDFDEAEARLRTGQLSGDEAVERAQASIARLRRLVHLPMDDVNISTFMHRLSRLVAHPALRGQAQSLQYHDVMEVLVGRFEILMDRHLRHEATVKELRRVGDRAISPAKRSATLPRPLPLGTRSLASAFWACGNCGWPLSQEQLDKFGAYILLRESELAAHHLSMLMLALAAYADNHRPLNGRVFKVLLERAGKLPAAQFEPRTVLNVLSPAAAVGCVPSQATVDNLCNVVLQRLAQFEPNQLGGLLWALGKSGLKPANSRELFRSISGQAWRQLEAWDCHQLGNLLYGFALLDHYPGSVFLDAVASRLAEDADTFSPQSLANVGWAWARLKYTPEREIASRVSPTFYCLKKSMPMLNAYEDQLGVIWLDAAGVSSSNASSAAAAGGGGQAWASAAAGGGGSSSVLGRVEPRLRLQLSEVRERLVEVAERAAARRKAAEKAAASAAAASASADDDSDVLDGSGRGGWLAWDKNLPTDRQTVRSLAERITAARARRAATADLVATAEAAVAAARASAGLQPRASLPLAQQQQQQQQLLQQQPLWPPPPQPQQQHFSRQQQQQQQRGALQPVGSAVDERSLTALTESIVTGRRGGALSTSSSVSSSSSNTTSEGAEQRRAVRRLLPPVKNSVIAAAEVVFDDFSGAHIIEPHYPASLLFLPHPSTAFKGNDGSSSSTGSVSGGSSSEHHVEQQQSVHNHHHQQSREDGDALLARILGSSGASSSSSELERQLVSDAFPVGLQPELPATSTPQQQQQQQQQQQEETPPGSSAAGSSTSSSAGGNSGSTVGDGDSGKKGAQAGSRMVGEASVDEQAERLQARDSQANELTLSVVPRAVKDRWLDEPRLTLDGLAEAGIKSLERASAQEVSTLLWSFATQAHMHPPLFRAAYARAEQALREFSVQGLSILCWSGAVLGEKPPPGLLQAIVSRAQELLCKQGRNVHSLCNLIWSLAVFDQLDVATFSALLQFMPTTDQELRAIPRPAWCQIFQAALYLEATTGRHYSHILPEPLLHYAQMYWESRDTTTSLHQRDVASVLQYMGIQHEQEFTFNERAFTVDIAVRGSDGTQLAIEVDGPHHFTVNPPYRPLASTDMRNRLLAHHGWRVVSIPVEAWRQLVTLGEKQHYLHTHVLCHIPQHAQLLGHWQGGSSSS